MLTSASTYNRVVFLSGRFHTVMDVADLILEKLLYQEGHGVAAWFKGMPWLLPM
uniref:Uncharacterized protein n=1 Tax=Triticum urartu TaxID=4572 RepID=A0A8R7U8X5_TRIUA